MQQYLFYTFLAIFCLTALIALLGIANIITIQRRFLDKLFYGLIIEVISAVVMLFRASFLNDDYKQRGSYEAVAAFYKHIEAKEYKDAYQLMSKESPHVKTLGWELFNDGYKYTSRIHLISIVPNKVDESHTNDYIVYYVDEVDAPIIDELDELNLKKASELSSLAGKLDELKKRIQAEGFIPKTVDQLTMAQLFPPNRGDILRLFLKRDHPSHKEADYLFPNKQIVKFVQGRFVIAGKEGDTWKIESITPLETVNF